MRGEAYFHVEHRESGGYYSWIVADRTGAVWSAHPTQAEAEAKVDKTHATIEANKKITEQFKHRCPTCVGFHPRCAGSAHCCCI